MRTALLALLVLLIAASTASAQEPTPLPAPPGSEAEPNDSPESATPIAAGDRIRAARTHGDVDHYRFTAEAGDRVFAAVVTSGSIRTNSRLALLAPDGSVIEADNDNGSFAADSSSIAGATIPAAGTYYLRVDAAAAAHQLLPYDLVLDVHSGEAEGRLVSGTKEAGEHDDHAIELGAGDTVFVSLDLDPERDGTHFNGGVGFGRDALLGADDPGNSDATPSEAFVGTVSSAGVHTVRVASADASRSGTYLLSITVIRAVERSCRTYSISPPDGTIADRAATTFPIDVPDAATIDHMAVRLDLTHTFMADLDAELEAPAGNRVALFDDIGSTNTGQHTRMLATFDDNAGTSPQYAAVLGVGVQPERYRLGWFTGQQAAGTWKLTLRDDALEDAGTLARADLILCAQPEDGPTESVFAAGFESGDDGFEHSGTADEWERGTPATPVDGGTAGLTQCADGTGCFKTDLDGTYDPSSSQDLVSPPISLAGRTGRIFASWKMWYQVEYQPFEHFTVSVEEDGGAGARTLFTATGFDMVANQGNPLTALALSAGWGRHRADVSDYAGKTIRLRFHLDSDNSVQRRGVAIDEVRVYQPRAVADADAYEIDEDTPLSVGAPGVLGNDGEATAATLESGPQHGRLELDADGSFTYTPARDYYGADSFTYRSRGDGAASEPATVTIEVRAVDDPAPPAASAPEPPAAVAPSSAPPVVDSAISDLQLASRCVRRSASGRVRVRMTMRLARPGAVRVRVDRAVGSRGRRSCPKANPERNLRFRRVATFRKVTRVRAQTAAVTRRVALDLRLRPGLYRLTVRVGDTSLRRFLRVVG